MAPKSILKKRAAPEPEVEEVVEVPASKSGPAPAFQGQAEGSSDEDAEDESSDDLGSDEEGDVDDSDDDEDDEDAIREMGEDKPRPAKKLKHTTLRPTPAPSFSLALNHLLSLPPSTSSLQPKNAPPSAQSLRLERRAKSLIRDTKNSHLERGHVRDVIAGWGSRPPVAFSLWDSKSARQFEQSRLGADGLAEETGAEREKRLRRLAQRGVVRLFNAISAAQGAPEKAEKDEAKKRKREDGGSEAGSTAAGSEVAPVNKILRRPNVLGGRGKGEALSNLSKASFLDLIRAGTT